MPEPRSNARMGGGPIATWMYDHPTSYVVVVCLIVAGLIAAVGSFALAVETS